jgi:hypothetical protein
MPAQSDDGLFRGIPLALAKKQINTNAINKVTMYGRRLGRPKGDVILIITLILDLSLQNQKFII